MNAPRFLAITALSMALAAPAYALENPTPGKHDPRVRYVDYDPSNVVDLWTAPGAILTVQFAPDETIAGVAVSDSHTLKADKRKNFLILKPEGCLVPEPVVVLTNLPDGQLRRYTFQIETHPQICQNPKPVITASVADDPPPGNLRYISRDALADGADVDYAVVYRYPGDEAEKRRAAARAAAEKRHKEQANRILAASTSFDTKDPYSGDRNYRYMWRGDVNLMPRWVSDNGYSTAFVYPGQQRMPSLYYVAPDGKESTATYSVDRDTIIATGTAREWRLRDGQTVIEVFDLSYNPVGSTPGTGTASPYVERVLKRGGDDR